MSFSRGDASAQPSHTRLVVVERAPAVFWVPCANRDCKNGGHELTPQVLAALRQQRASFTGSVRCEGELGGNGSPCTGELHFEATATFG